MSKPVLWDFENWFTLMLPPDWTYERDVKAVILSFYSTAEDAKGALQISLHRRLENKTPVRNFVMDQLERFINQRKINYDINTKKVMEGPYFAVANASGTDGEYFIEIWMLANHEKFLHITYYSKEKTKELRTAENIVYSIRLH